MDGQHERPTEFTPDCINADAINELLTQISPNEKMSPESNKLIRQIAADLFEKISSEAINIAIARGSDQLEKQDILFAAKSIAGSLFQQENESPEPPQPQPTATHLSRMEAVKQFQKSQRQLN